MTERPLSFIPGPSKIDDAVYRDIEIAMVGGILELSHRSREFVAIANQSIENLRAYLGVPDDYAVLYTDSASSAWHSMIANVVDEKCAHVVTGAFSAKAVYASRVLGKDALEYRVDLKGEDPHFPTIIDPGAELITVCYSESSNGSAWTHAELEQLRRQTDGLIAVDVTSCAGAIQLDLTLADIWYFSVQKAFGLPAGLGVLILSPKVLARARARTEKGSNIAGMWSWSELVEHQEHGRGPTPHTPNMLGIYLLAKRSARFLHEGGLSVIDAATMRKAEQLYKHFGNHPHFSPYIPHANYRSPTVIAIAGASDTIADAHQRAKEHGMVLGQGYAELKDTTLRIANFPAITDEDVDRLLSWI